MMRLFGKFKKPARRSVVRRYFGLEGHELRGAAHCPSTPNQPLTIALLDGTGEILSTTVANGACDRDDLPSGCGFAFPVPLAWLHHPHAEIKFSFRVLEHGIDFPEGGRSVPKRKLVQLARVEDADAAAGASTLLLALDAIPAGQKVFVIAIHELQRSGAPLIALSVARNIIARTGWTALTLCLDPSGPLASDFAQLGPLATGLDGLLRGDVATTEQLLSTLRQTAHPAALVNSLCSAPLAEALHRGGFKVVSLVHEFPFAFAQKFVDTLVAVSTEVIFPCEEVSTHFKASITQHSTTSSIMAQGAYMIEARDAAGKPNADGKAFRASLGIPPQAEIVLACGTVDHRKGFDWFASFALHFARYSTQAEQTHFVWLGKIHDQSLFFHGLHSLQTNGAAVRFHHVGAVEDPTDAYAAASLLLMCSRIDPYPSVVLEALANGLPVVGFDREQGTSTLIRETGLGAVVPSMDMEAARLAIEQILPDADLRAKVAATGPSLIRNRFRTSTYAAGITERLEKLGNPSTLPAAPVLPSANPPLAALPRLEEVSAWGSAPWKSLVSNDLKALRQRLRSSANPTRWSFPWGVVESRHLHTVPPQIEDIYLRDQYRFDPTGPAPRIIDGGGNLGLSALWFRKVYPDAEIIVYEPDPRLVAQIKTNLQQAGVEGVQLEPSALWISDGQMTFAGDADDRGQLSPDANSATQSSFTAETTDIARAVGAGVDLLKLDIEGAEFACLEHLLNTGAIHRVQRIAAELHLNQANTDQALLVLTNLRAAGFTIAYSAAIADWFGPESSPAPFAAVGTGKTFMQLFAWQ